MVNLSPMMRQYIEIKDKYKDYILFFRLGDFYEMFFDDAKVISKELELTLTGRDCGLEQRAPMCGIPYVSSESYISKLISKGYKIAICEQLEDPNETRGLVKRDVVRVITPGTVTDGNMLDDERNNFLASIYFDDSGFGVCFCDVSTGEVFISDITNKESQKNTDLERKLINELSSFFPCEILTNSKISKYNLIKKFIKIKLNAIINISEESEFDLEKSTQDILEYFEKQTLSELGFFSNNSPSIIALGALIKYLNFTYKACFKNLSSLNFYLESQYMSLDLAAKKNLEITADIKNQDKKKSLLGVLDKTKTPMGKRMIKKYIEQPLVNSVVINERLDAVEELVKNSLSRLDLTDSFSGIFDIERLLTKIVFKTISPRELLSFKYTIKNLSSLKSSLLTKLNNQIDLLEDIYKLIDDAITETPPALLRDGEIIKEGFNISVDEYRDILKNSKNYISKIETDEKARTGIKNLKIKYNKVFGYYIEISNSFLNKVPENYIRKQTLSNCERFIIEELKVIEEKILSASDIVINLEIEIYNKIINNIANNSVRIQKTASAISHLDVICSFANIATKNNYIKPIVDNSDIINIKEGRHPIVESLLKNAPFVSNDTNIDLKTNKISIITGPNMAGKSTYMRQVALIVLMAQIGCFVPASFAHLGVVDGIFTRIGFSDDLSSGLSTFMVEMTEIAYILNNMTPKSLIILDEIGRGTSTYDGMSIAEAIVEHIASDEFGGGKTLFATHYHELSELPNRLSNTKNFSVAVKKNGDDITFLHRIVPTSTDKSYGLEVSKLAGIPDIVITRAKQILSSLESNIIPKPVSDNSQNSNNNNINNNINNKLIDELNKIDPEVLSPLEALNYLYKLKSIVLD